MDLVDDHSNISLLYDDKYEAIFEKLASRNVTSFELIVSDAKVIAEKCNIHADQVTQLVDALRAELMQQTVLEEATDDDVCSLGDDVFDALLGGGLRCGTITEVFGLAGAGKSNLLTQLCASIQIPRTFGGCDRNAIYISTESGLETRRLIDFVKRFNGLGYDRVSTDRVLTFWCQSREELLHVLKYQVPIVAAKQNVGLLVIDSLANPYRGKAAELFDTAHVLRNLAHDLNLAVVVANQISSAEFEIDVALHANSLAYQLQFYGGSGAQSFEPRARRILGTTTTEVPSQQPVPSQTPSSQGPPPSQWPQSQNHTLGTPPLSQQTLLTKEKLWMNIPSLGHEWTSFIDVRIELEKTNRHKRIFHLIFSPFAAGGTRTGFEISADKVCSTTTLSLNNPE